MQLKAAKVGPGPGLLPLFDGDETLTVCRDYQFLVFMCCMRLSSSFRSPDFSYDRPMSMSSEPMSMMAHMDNAVAVVAKATAPESMMMR